MGVLDVRAQAQESLAQWGLWASENHYPGVVTPPPPPAPSATRLDVLGNPLCMTDEQAMRIDRAVGTLVRLDKRYPHVARLYFCSGLSYRDIARQLAVSKDKAASIVGEIIVWVASVAVKEVA